MSKRKPPVRPDYPDDDPMASEVRAIRDMAEALTALASEWLDQRERHRQHQAEQTEAREYRTETELLREGPQR